MIGFDWPLRWKWINSRKNVFTSGQFFHIHTLDYPSGVDVTGTKISIAPDASPYPTWTIPEDHFYASLLLRTEYMNERLVPSILYVHDFHTDAYWSIVEVGYKIGNHWRPMLRWLNAHGPFQQSFGLYRDRDEIAVRIEYQF